eukprot:scaffold202224_cov15-Prasinocladus_malaysianus.AAC.1
MCQQQQQQHNARAATSKSYIARRIQHNDLGAYTIARIYNYANTHQPRHDALIYCAESNECQGRRLMVLS